MSQKFYITTPIYYTNQKPHIGTAYTTIAADVMCRYQKQQGKEAFFLTGTDEHGEKIAQAAEANGKDPQKFVDEIAQEFKNTWQRLNLDYSEFIRTTDKRHEEGVLKFVSELKEKGCVYQDEYRALYCSGCEDFIFQKDLTKDGLCPYHQKKPELISETNYFFDLKQFLAPVREAIEEDKLIIEPKERKSEVLGLLDQDLGNLSISREKVDWGIPLPFDKNQTLYVWVDALLNYLTAIGYKDNSEEFQKFWPPDIQFLAKDILKFHAIYWPAMLLAVGLPIPKKLFVHGFFTVNGQKMSKTLGNVLDPVELAEEYGADALRYFILREIPFGQDGDVSVERFRERYQADLANGLGNLVARVLTLSEKAGAEVVDEADSEINQEIKEKEAVYHEAMKEIRFNGALESIWQLIGYLDEYIEKYRPWEMLKNDPEKARLVLGELLSAIKKISVLVFPFMPETAEKIKEQIDRNKRTEGLFPRLE